MSHPDPSRSCAQEASPKRRQILAGAREVFRDGLRAQQRRPGRGAAGVSKATVYNHFHDKKALYVAYLSEEADTLRDSVRCMLLRSEPVGEVATALQSVGERLLALFLDPTIVGFYRNTSAEVSASRSSDNCCSIAARPPCTPSLVTICGAGTNMGRCASIIRMWPPCNS